MKITIGDLVRNPFGAVYEVIDISKYPNSYCLKHINGVDKSWYEIDEIEDWDKFHKIK